MLIFGSANINDISLLGERDSEICLIIEGGKMVDSVMNAKPVKVSKFAYDFRKRLFNEHLGELGDVLQDPISDVTFHEMFVKRAQSNTEIFSQFFKTIPSDQIDTWEELTERENLLSKIAKNFENMPLKTAPPGLANIKGTVVVWPMYFLRKESLTPSISSAEGFVADDVFQ